MTLNWIFDISATAAEPAGRFVEVLLLVECEDVPPVQSGRAGARLVLPGVGEDAFERGDVQVGENLVDRGDARARHGAAAARRGVLRGGLLEGGDGLVVEFGDQRSPGRMGGGVADLGDGRFPGVARPVPAGSWSGSDVQAANSRDAKIRNFLVFCIYLSC